ncbi:MAG: hypothetical protein JSW28_02275 [Thermoplasmata archaeon]|nr:MAG: hypothetical protein JSW28_02275 [Thermoplasmata archaeon]
MVETMLGGHEPDDMDSLREPIRHILSEKYVHFKRAGEILAALSKYGFGRLWDSASVLKDVPFDSTTRKDIARLKN